MDLFNILAGGETALRGFCRAKDFRVLWCWRARASLRARTRSCSVSASAPSTPATTTTSGRSLAGSAFGAGPACPLSAASPACAAICHVTSSGQYQESDMALL